ncbi:MAG: hypothetical protein IKX23_01685 [Treponema sp.]|nr:hypothetical protein [Treponema sp.]
MELTFNDLNWYGRYTDYNKIRYFNYSLSGFSFVFTGKKAEITVLSDADSFPEENQCVLGVYVSTGTDLTWKNLAQKPAARYLLTKNETKITLFESDCETTAGITVFKLSECAFAYAGLKNIQIDGVLEQSGPDQSGLSPMSRFSKKLEFIGDSITCGYGIDGKWEKDTFNTWQERPDSAYSFLTARNLNAQISCVSWSGIGITSNYVDPETVNLPDTHLLMPALWPYTDKNLSQKFNLEPEVWDESKYSPDIIIVHLGTNDLSWVRNIEERRLNFESCYRQFLEAIHRRSPKAKIICCLGAMGTDLNETIHHAVELFKKDFKSVVCKTVDFPLQRDEDGIGADWHPSAETHRKMAAILTEELKKL